MDLSSVTVEELVSRWSELCDRLDKVFRDIGPYLELAGRLEKELVAITDELKKRDADG